MTLLTRYISLDPSTLPIHFAAVGMLLLALVLVSGPAEAQITRGAISGTVRDATGAVVPGATVTVTNLDTNVTRNAVTDSLGFYQVKALDPGRYAVRIELSGFSTVENRDIPVRSATEVTLNLDLSIARFGEELTVTGKTEAAELNKSNPTISLTTTGRQAVELPLPGGRNINNLILLTPNTFSVTGQGTFATNGQRSRNNNYMIDGSDNNDLNVTLSTSIIPPEAVAEFHVQSNAYNVEFGRNSGAQVTVITKSGSVAGGGVGLPPERRQAQYPHQPPEEPEPDGAAQRDPPPARRLAGRADRQGQDVLLRPLPVGRPGQRSGSERFRMRQRQLIIRADLLNAFNQDDYGNPVNNLNSPSFGQNTNDWGNRTIVLSAKIVF